MPKMLLEIGSIRQAAFCKTSQISQKTSNIESLFRKIVNPQGCNCTKKDPSLVFSCEYVHVNTFFHFYFFVSEKTKTAIGDVL